MIPTTVHAVAECTTVTVASTYTSSCSCASLEELITALATATCTSNSEVHTADQMAVNKTSSIKATVEHFTETVITTVTLTSLPSSFPCKNTSTLLVALPTSVEDIGYVETAECASFRMPQLFADIHVISACLSMMICDRLCINKPFTAKCNFSVRSTAK